MLRFLSSRTAAVLTIVLVLEGAFFYATASRPERTPAVMPLSLFPAAFNGWNMAQDIPIEKEVQDVLKATDTLNRVYVNPSSGAAADLFIAYFQTQRTGASPHSPKNCLPGSGWEPLNTGRQAISVPGREPLLVNRYIVAKGDQKSVVLYWYQSHNRVIASEFSAKFWLVADAIRYRRSDTALVKVVVPVSGDLIAQSLDVGVKFVQAVFPALEVQLPS